jgi:molybdopterin-guanine dinucleotide biosynthesis adapter protein
MSKKRLAVAFTGPSNSGKTTLIVKVAARLIHEYGKEVAVIKNDPKDKARFDIYKFTDSGAEVIVTSPNRTTLFSHRHHELEDLIGLFGHFDVLLVEGLKTLPLPRISVFRDRIDESYFPYMNALAVDESVALEAYTLPGGVDVLDLNDPDAVIDWILNHAKEI